jgi:hypothetical protein
MDKSAAEAAPASIPSRMIRNFIPFAPDRRDPLEPFELKQMEEGQSQWFPPIFQTDATPMPHMMASPARQGLLAGATAGALGGAAGYGAGQYAGIDPRIGAAIGGIPLGMIAALLQYKKRWKKNEHIEEVLRRLEPGSTRRDFVVQEMLEHALARRYGATNLE